jgi:hypothetical protein
MPRTTLLQRLSKLDRWMSFRFAAPVQATTLHWWNTPKLFDRFSFRVLLIATLGGVLYLPGCNSATRDSGGREYIGTWESARTPGLTMTITQKGDQFIVHTMQLGGTDRLATVRNGLLQFSDGSGTFLEYHKETNTLTSSGNKDFLYRRKD